MENFLSVNIFCGVFAGGKKKQWKEWILGKYIFQTVGQGQLVHFFLSAKPFPLTIQKNHSLILDLEPSFQRNTLPGNMHGIPTDNRTKHKRMESDHPRWSLLLAYQVTSNSISLDIPNVLLDCKLLVDRC